MSHRERVARLLDVHKRNELSSLKASGTEEEYDERERLLTELSSLIEETKLHDIEKKQRKENTQQQTEEQGREIRQAAMESMKREDHQNQESTPKRKRQRTEDIVEFLREKHENETRLREKELELQRERLQIEKKEREAMLAVMAQLVEAIKK